MSKKSRIDRRYLPEDIWRLLETVLDETFEFHRRSRHHMLLLLSLHRHWRNWKEIICNCFEIQNNRKKCQRNHSLPTTVNWNIWLIFGFVETWHSKLPASVALVNFSFKVFCPRLKKSFLLKNISNGHPPSWYQLKSLIIDVFFISNKKGISIKRPYPRNL